MPEGLLIGDGNGNGRKQWHEGIPAWMRGAAILGPTAMIALFLVYQIPAKTEALAADFKDHARETVQAVQDFKNFKDQQAEVFEELLHVMRQVCINTSKKGEEEKCF